MFAVNKKERKKEKKENMYLFSKNSPCMPREILLYSMNVFFSKETTSQITFKFKYTSQ